MSTACTHRCVCVLLDFLVYGRSTHITPAKEQHRCFPSCRMPLDPPLVYINHSTPSYSDTIDTSSPSAPMPATPPVIWSLHLMFVPWYDLFFLNSPIATSHSSLSIHLPLMTEPLQPLVHHDVQDSPVIILYYSYACTYVCAHANLHAH